MLKLNTNILNGVWVKLADDNVEFKLKPLDRSLIPADCSDEDFGKLLKDCILDWKGVVDYQDNALPFNPENKEIVLQNFPSFKEGDKEITFAHWLVREVTKLHDRFIALKKT